MLVTRKVALSMQTRRNVFPPAKALINLLPVVSNVYKMMLPAIRSVADNGAPANVAVAALLVPQRYQPMPHAQVVRAVFE